MLKAAPKPVENDYQDTWTKFLVVKLYNFIENFLITSQGSVTNISNSGTDCGPGPRLLDHTSTINKINQPDPDSSIRLDRL